MCKVVLIYFGWTQMRVMRERKMDVGVCGGVLGVGGD